MEGLVLSTPLADALGKNERPGNKPGLFTHGTVVPEPSTYIAGALLLLPFGAQAVRRLRMRKRVVLAPGQ